MLMDSLPKDTVIYNESSVSYILIRPISSNQNLNLNQSSMGDTQASVSKAEVIMSINLYILFLTDLYLLFINIYGTISLAFTLIHIDKIDKISYFVHFPHVSRMCQC